MQVSSSQSSPRLVMHLTCGSLPWVTGGREVYAHSLARELKPLGWDSLIVLHQTPGNKEPIGEHVYDGIPVVVLPPLPAVQRSQVYSCRTEEVTGFRELLHKRRPLVVHFQDFSYGTNLLHLDEIKSTQAKTLMTIHSPGQSCLQREMLYNGKTPCDGEIKLDRCTACRLGVMGIPLWIRWPLSKLALPEIGDNLLSRALSARSMTQLFESAFAEMVNKIDRIHVLSQWVKEVFERNHVPQSKLTLIRSGLTISQAQYHHAPSHEYGETLKLVMIGRCEAIKGQDILIDAIQQMNKSLKVHVSFIGPYWDSSEYGKKCLAKIQGDDRFALPRLVPHHEIPSVLSEADALVIPSVWFENAPLVVLEAQAYGLPVIGSKLGGIPELVTDQQTGLLFTVGSAADLRHCIETVYHDRTLLARFRGNISKPRMMHDVAKDTAQIYEALL